MSSILDRSTWSVQPAPDYYLSIFVQLSSLASKYSNMGYTVAIVSVDPGNSYQTLVWDGVGDPATYGQRWVETNAAATVHTVRIAHTWIIDPMTPVVITEYEDLVFTSPNPDGSGGGTGDTTGDTDTDDIPDTTRPPGKTTTNPPGNPHNPHPRRSIAAGTCYDGRRRGWEVRAYRLDATGAWKRTRFPSKAVQECRYTHRRDGGMAQCDVTMTAPMDAPPNLQTGDRISVWVRQASGWVEVWRGYYQTGTHATDRPDTYELTAYGAIERMRGIRVSRQYAMEKADLAALVAQVLTDYMDPWYRDMGMPVPMRDVQPVGVRVGETRVLEGPLSETVSGLVSSVPGVTWGVDLDGFGRERVYVRPRPADVRYVAALGKDATHAAFGTDASEIVNALTIDGGPALFPNLIKNGSFEKPTGEGANLVYNPSFEDVQQKDWKTALHWDRTAGDPTVFSPEHQQDDNTLNAASGERYLELDNYKSGREEVQGTPVVVAGNARYTFRCHLAAENTAYPCAVRIYLKLWDASDAYLGAIDVSGGTAPVHVVQNVVWSLYETDFTTPPTAHTLAVVIGLPNGAAGRRAGIGVDDVHVFAADSVRQEAWHANANDTAGSLPASTVEAHWAERDPAVGAYAAQVNWNTGNHADCYAGIETDPIAVRGYAEHRLTFYAKDDAAGTALDVIVHWYDGKEWKRLGDSAIFDHPGGTAGDGTAITAGRRFALTSAYQRFRMDIRTPEKASQIVILFGGSGANKTGAALVDGCYLHVGWPVDGNGAPAIYPYVEGGAVVSYRFTTEDAWFQDPADPIGRYATEDARNSAWWHTGPDAGTVHHGIREDRVSAPKVRTPEDAMKYAVNYFNLHAVEQTPSPIVLSDRFRNVRPDGLVRLCLAGRDGLTLFPVSATHVFNRVGWSCTVERSEERGDLASLIAGIGQTVYDRHTVLAMAAQAGQERTTVIIGGISTPTPAVYATEEHAGQDLAAGSPLVLTLGQAAAGDVSVWVNGAKWRQSLLQTAVDGLSVTINPPDAGWAFSATDLIEVRYETET